MPCAPDGGRCKHHHRHAIIDQGHINACHPIDRPTGRQQSAADRPFRINKINGNRRTGARHTVNAGLPRLLHPPLRGFNHQIGQRAGIDRPHAHFGHGVLGFDQTALNRKGADTGENIAAIGGRIDQRLVHAHLTKQIVNIHPCHCRFGNDRHFAGQRMRPADPIHLTRIGRSHHRQQHRIAQSRILRQIVCEEIGTCGGAAAHQHAGNAVCVRHPFLPIC